MLRNNILGNGGQRLGRMRTLDLGVEGSRWMEPAVYRRLKSGCQEL